MVSHCCARKCLTISTVKTSLIEAVYVLQIEFHLWQGRLFTCRTEVPYLVLNGIFMIIINEVFTVLVHWSFSLVFCDLFFQTEFILPKDNFLQKLSPFDE